jgi:hypothetical protein
MNHFLPRDSCIKEDSVVYYNVEITIIILRHKLAT